MGWLVVGEFGMVDFFEVEISWLVDAFDRS